jgi:hypothetical protein
MDPKLTHKLSDEDNRRIFFEEILPIEFSDIVHKPHPVVIFVGGQPGAGKTALQKRIFTESQLTNALVINGDDFRAYHPENEELLKSDDTMAAYYTDADVGMWIGQAIDIAKENHANALVEGTLRRPEITIKSAGAFKNCGYVAELHVIITQEFFSRLRILFRYLDQRKNEGYGRYTMTEAHDASYSVLPNSLNEIVTADIFNRLVLYTVEHDVVYDSILPNKGAGKQIENLLSYIRADIHKPIEALLADLHDAKTLASQLNCKQIVFDDIQNLTYDILKYIAIS